MGLAVRRRPTFPGFQKLLGLVVVILASALFLAGGTATPGSAYGLLFITAAAVGLGYCAVTILRAAGTAVSSRPALLLDDDGVHVPRAWPLPAGDRLLPWSDLGAVCAWSQGPPAGGRGAAMSRLQLSFLPVRPEGAPLQVESGAELLATKVAELPCAPTLRFTLSIRPGWDTTLEQIIAAVAEHAPDAPFADRRELPKPKPKPRKAGR